MRTTSAETGITAIAELLAKQISACELFQEEKRLDYKKKKKKVINYCFPSRGLDTYSLTRCYETCKASPWQTVIHILGVRLTVDNDGKLFTFFGTSNEREEERKERATFLELISQIGGRQKIRIQSNRKYLNAYSLQKSRLKIPINCHLREQGVVFCKWQLIYSASV